MLTGASLPISHFPDLPAVSENVCQFSCISLSFSKQGPQAATLAPISCTAFFYMSKNAENIHLRKSQAELFETVFVG